MDSYFVVNGKGQVISSWEYKEDAEDAKRSPLDYHGEADIIQPIKVYTKTGAIRKGIAI